MPVATKFEIQVNNVPIFHVPKNKFQGQDHVI